MANVVGEINKKRIGSMKIGDGVDGIYWEMYKYQTR